MGLPERSSGYLGRIRQASDPPVSAVLVMAAPDVLQWVELLRQTCDSPGHKPSQDLLVVHQGSKEKSRLRAPNDSLVYFAQSASSS